MRPLNGSIDAAAAALGFPPVTATPHSLLLVHEVIGLWDFPKSLSSKLRSQVKLDTLKFPETLR